jgi:hypothetical protein
MASNFVRGSGTNAENLVIRIKKRNSDVYIVPEVIPKDEDKDISKRVIEESSDNGVISRRTPDIRYTCGDGRVGSK